MTEETYTHLVLLLDKDMSIKRNENSSTESIYIRKQKVSLPEGVEVRDFTVDNLQDTLAEVDGENLRLDVYLNDDLRVAKYKVSSDEFDTGSTDYEPVEFDGTKMYAEIVRNAQKTNENTRPPPPPPKAPQNKGGMKLNKKPKKKTKKGTYKRQSNKTK